jgi:hypothetical protein
VAKPKKEYTMEETQTVIREKLTKLGGNEASIQGWFKNMETNPDRNFMTQRLISGESEFERKDDGSFTIVVEMGFGGPMFDDLSFLNTKPRKS